MAVTDDEIRKIREDLAEQISVLVSAMDATRMEGSDETREAERNAKEKLDLTFWNLIFNRHEQVVAGSPGDILEFTPEDYLLFNFGWVDDNFFSKSLLTTEDSFSNPEIQIMYLTEWLSKEDTAHLEVEVRRRIGEALEHIKGEIAKKGDLVVSLDVWRRTQVSEVGVADEYELLQKVTALETASLATYKLEKLRRRRSLDKDEVTALAANLTEQSRLEVAVMRALQEAPEEPRTRFAQINQKIIGLGREISECQDKQAHLESLQKLTHERYELRRAERRLHLEDKLKEIKEDIRFCSKWGRSEYFAVLLSERALNHKALIVETTKVIEDFDPKIFNNKMVERRGKPTIVLTPGTGNGSYDFRSNTIIIPVTSPHSVLESLAYAFALYRRDIDQEYNESKMWESFFSDDVWRGIKDRERPRHFRARMVEFVKCYTDWITKESKGLMVLDLEIRRWFEENIAPEKRGLIVPRELRHVKIAEREKLLQHYMESPTPHAAYMAGVLLFKMGDFEHSDRQFERAMDIAPESPEPHWARAILMMLDERDMKGFDGEYIRKIRLKDRLTTAKDELLTFTKVGAQSWWTLKAQEHIRKLSEQIAQFGRR